MTRFASYQRVTYVRIVELIGDQPFTERGFHIELPHGRAQLTFRCGACGGDLVELQRSCLGLMKRGEA